MREINCLMLFEEIIAVYTENHVEPINTKCRIIFKALETYSSHWAFKG
jgi:hypothetical protein